MRSADMILGRHYIFRDTIIKVFSLADGTGVWYNSRELISFKPLVYSDTIQHYNILWLSKISDVINLLNTLDGLYRYQKTYQYILDYSNLYIKLEKYEKMFL